MWYKYSEYTGEAILWQFISGNYKFTFNVTISFVKIVEKILDVTILFVTTILEA